MIGRTLRAVLFASLLAAAPATVLARQSAPAATTNAIQALLERNDLPGAKAAVTRALVASPDDPALHNFAGVIEAQQGAYTRAESHFLRAIELAPRQTAAYENLGRLYQEHAREDPDARTKALRTYRQLLRVAPDDAEGLYQAAFLHALNGEFQESASLVARLPAELRQQAHVRALEVVVRSGTGDRAAADAGTRAISADPELSAADIVPLLPALDRLPAPEAERALLDALVARGRATPDVLHRLGQVEIRQQQYAAAETVLQQALAAGAAPVPVLIDLARAADKQKHHEAALGYLGHARALEPENATVHFLFGVVSVELDLVAEAYESLKKALALEPDNPAANYMMGVVAMHRHEPSESLPFLEKYVRLRPDDPRGRFVLGMGRFHAGDLDGARADLAQVADRPETTAGACYFLARIARQSNDLDAAQRYVERSIAAAGTYADAWAELGLIQTRKREYAEAERSLQQALSIDPENYQATVNLTALYTRTRDPRRADQAAKLTALQQKREARAQEFLRSVEVVPQ